MDYLIHRFKKQNFKNPYTNNEFNPDFIKDIANTSNRKFVKTKPYQFKDQEGKTITYRDFETYETVEYQYKDIIYVYEIYVLESRFNSNQFQVFDEKFEPILENGNEVNFDQNFINRILHKKRTEGDPILLDKIFEIITNDLFEKPSQYIEIVVQDDYDGERPTYKEYESIMSLYKKSIIGDDKTITDKFKEETKKVIFILLNYERYAELFSEIVNFNNYRFCFDAEFLDKCFKVYEDKTKHGGSVREDIWNPFFDHCTRYATVKSGERAFYLLYKNNKFDYCKFLIQYSKNAENQKELLKNLYDFVEEQKKIISSKENVINEDLEKRSSLFSMFNNLYNSLEFNVDSKPKKMKFDDEKEDTSTGTSTSSTGTSTTSTSTSTSSIASGRESTLVEAIIEKGETMKMTEKHVHVCNSCGKSKCILHTVDPDKKYVMGFCSAECMEKKFE